MEEQKSYVKNIVVIMLWETITPQNVCSFNKHPKQKHNFQTNGKKEHTFVRL
jgi:hypothetical protein